MSCFNLTINMSFTGDKIVGENQSDEVKQDMISYRQAVRSSFGVNKGVAVSDKNRNSTIHTVQPQSNEDIATCLKALAKNVEAYKDSPAHISHLHISIERTEC